MADGAATRSCRSTRRTTWASSTPSSTWPGRRSIWRRPDSARSTARASGSDPDGRPIIITVLTQSRYPLMVDALEFIKPTWEKVGIELRIDNVAPELVSTRLEANQYDCTPDSGELGYLDMRGRPALAVRHRRLVVRAPVVAVVRGREPEGGTAGGDATAGDDLPRTGRRQDRPGGAVRRDAADHRDRPGRVLDDGDQSPSGDVRDRHRPDEERPGRRQDVAVVQVSVSRRDERRASTTSKRADPACSASSCAA